MNGTRSQMVTIAAQSVRKLEESSEIIAWAEQSGARFSVSPVTLEPDRDHAFTLLTPITHIL